jgi:hypothetical protein
MAVTSWPPEVLSSLLKGLDMKTTKSQAVLLRFEIIMNTGTLVKSDFLAKIEISDTTFKRYVSEIRSYLMNFHNDLEIVYRKSEEAYFLVK